MATQIDTPRYLAAFHPKRIPHYFADILVIGGGIAGLRAALAVAPNQSVIAVTKDAWEESSSHYAQGGIASVTSPTDSFEKHIEDTLIAGGVLCQRDVVEDVVRAAPAQIDDLIGWGARFDASHGELALGREGGHQDRRILHALGDATGKEIMRAIQSQVHLRPNIDIWEHTLTVDLLVHEGRCRGALLWNPHHGRTLLWAKQTLLCTGGAGQIYRETTNPAVATGDGQALAFRAGVELRDMEFVQFHPTVLYIAGSSRSLITEAVRGEGARLCDAQGHRFMPDYDERAELAPRDVVSQAIANQMKKTERPHVYLRMDHLDAAHVRQRFPGIARTCRKFGIDITCDPIPVRPGAHYMIGGVTIDADARTTLPGLWAAGEVTSSGLHGANRLASNSLLEGLVFGARAGRGASAAASAMPTDFEIVPLSHALDDSARDPAAEETLDLGDIRNSLKSLMWHAAGVQRNGPSLCEAIHLVTQWSSYVWARQFRSPPGWELQNMLLAARLVLDAAYLREESRGVHYRTDFPQTNDTHWCRHLPQVNRPC